MCRVCSQLREAGEVRRGRGRVGSFVIRISFELRGWGQPDSVVSIVNLSAPTRER